MVHRIIQIKNYLYKTFEELIIDIKNLNSNFERNENNKPTNRYTN